MSGIEIYHSVTDLLSAMVERPSFNTMGLEPPNGTQTSFGLWLRDYLRAIGADEVRTTEPEEGVINVFGAFDFGCDETIVFNAHLDTVPFEKGPFESYSGKIHQSKLWGRGSCDDKGSMACMLMALAGAKSNQLYKPKYNVLFIATGDEEHAFKGSRHLTEKTPDLFKMIRGQWPVGVIVAEPTMCRPIIMHKGVTRWRVVARGKSAHSSTPELGQNAIVYMSKFVIQIERKALDLREKQQGHPIVGHATLSPGVIHGGTAVNIVPDLCMLDLDRRLLPEETPESATDELRTLAEACGVTLGEPIMWGLPLETPRDARITQIAVAAADAVGSRSEPGWANFATDASFFAAANVPAVVIGAGDIAVAHTKEEHIELTQLSLGQQLYEAILRGSSPFSEQ